MAQEMLAQRLARKLKWLDPAEDKVQPVVRQGLRKAMPLRDLLDGTWLGAPLHPAMTDVPVGATTTALVLDAAELVSGSRRMGEAADRALAVGVISTLPVAVTGTTDWRDLLGEQRRIAALHGLINIAALGLNVYSLVCRMKGSRTSGRVASIAGMLVTGLAAHVGGELAYGSGVRVNQDVWHRGPKEFTEVLDEQELQDGELRRVDVRGAKVLVTRSRNGTPCAIAATCSHAGGPLDRGERVEDSVICPWHGSCFDLRSGSVINGPAVFPQPHYETRVQNGRIAIRLAQP